MNTKNYPTILKVKALWTALAIMLICNFSALAQDCMLLPMTLQQRIQVSPLVIEGEVLSQQSFWSQGHKTIYTLNKVKVYKIFKGNATASIIDVITEGGTVGMDRIVHSATLALSVGDMGVLMCIPNPYADSGIGGYTPYGSLAGFLRYEPDGSAHDPYATYHKIDADLHSAIKGITNAKIRNVASNPKLGDILNKSAVANGSTNKQGGGGYQIEATPTITSFSPTSVASGIGTTITITGTNFGSTRGTGGIEFRNADDGGATWIRPLSTDYVSWSATQIVVKVPSTNASGNGAGTGQIRVVNSDASANTATSSQTLTVTYAYSNLIYDNTARMATHIKDNMAGGYTFLLDQSSGFSANTNAVSKMRLVMDRWTCASGINWLIGGNTSTGVADDGLNVACFSASLPASVLARCTSYYSGCGTTPFDWYVKEIDVAVKSTVSWYYGTGSPSASEYDFETVMLHEIGHGHQLNHVIDAAAVMHYGVAAGETKRTLNANDITGANFVKNRDLSVGGICSQSAMTVLGCGAGTSAPIVNFSANRTAITVGCSVTFTSEALPQATAWSWNFNGGATNSTLENPTVTFNTPGTYTVSLTATNANGSTTTTRSNYIVVSALACSATLVNWSGSSVDYNAAGSGKLVGHNAAGDLAFADKFLYCGTSTKLTQLKYYFNTSTGSGNVTAKVWNANGAGGSPGTELFSQVVPIASLPDFANPTVVDIPSGLLLSSDYFIGFEIAYAGSDAVSLITNFQGESAVSSGWRKSGAGTWNSYLDMYGSSLSLRIEGVVNNAPTATISAGGATTFCAGGNVQLNANTGSGLSYLWFNGLSSTGVTTSTYTTTTSGSYTVRVTYAGCSTTSSATVVTVNPAPTATITPAGATTFCSGGSVTLNANTGSGLTYMWFRNGSPLGINTSTYVATVGGNYTVEVTSAGCSTTSSVTAVTVNTCASTNNNLANLTLSSGSLNPIFAQATTSYTASVPFTVSAVTLTPTVADATATVTVNSIPVASGSLSGAIALSIGPNVITTVVTAEDSSTKTYTVTVTRAAASSNANLSNLTLSAGSLNPIFSSSTTGYNVLYGSNQAAITVTPTVADPNATVTVNGISVSSGNASGSITLNPATTTITIVVTAQNGSTNTYTIIVTKRPSAVISGSQTICSGSSTSPMSIALTGQQPWSVTFFDGTSTATTSGITSSPYTFTTSPASTRTYTVTALSDANASALAADLSGIAVVTVVASIVYYADADGDGYGNPAIVQSSCSGAPIISGHPAVTNNTDCNDADSSVYRTGTFYIDADQDAYNAGQATICYGNNIPLGYSDFTDGPDCNDNNPFANTIYNYYADNDHDGFGAGTLVPVCAAFDDIAPFGYSINNTDCDDSNGNIYRTGDFLIDADGDGYDAGTANICYGATVPSGYSTTTLGTDCDDTNSNLFQTVTLYVDNDTDGYDAGSIAVCTGSAVPPGYSLTTNGSDCDDDNALTHESFLFYSDSDGDGYGIGTGEMVCAIDADTPPPFYSTNNSDCSDTDASIYRALELYVDNDIDGYGSGITQTVCIGDTVPPGLSETSLGMDCDDNNPSVNTEYEFYVDADGDGRGTGNLVFVCAVDANTPPVGYSLNNTDCDDTNSNIFATVPLYIDVDGDGYDAGFIMVCTSMLVPAPPGYSYWTDGPDCDDNNAAAHLSFQFYLDNDGDGFGSGSLVSVCAVDANTPPAEYSLNNTDCDDNNAAIFQSATLFVDFDGDGFDAGSSIQCYGASIPVGYTASTLGSDCDDSNALIYQQFAFYVDADGDGFGAGSLTMVCAMGAMVSPTGYVLNNSDCNDADNTIYQSATLYVDADSDGYTSGVTQAVCYGASIPSGYLVALTAIDCSDTIAAIHPNAAEIPFNGVDDNCNGSIDETGSIGVTTTLLSSSCGVTLAAIGSLIGIQTVGGHPITGYRIRATNGAQVQMIEKAVPHFTMTQFPSYAYATTYSIDIQLQRAGVWLTTWGAPCQVSTPAILEEGGAATVSPSQCGIVLAKINTLIATGSIPGVTGYRFRVTNLTDPLGPNAVQQIDRTQNWFSLQMLTRYNYGTTYRIEVAVKTTGAFGGFGAPCQVSSPAVPSLVNCSATIASGTATIAATSVSGAAQYRFQITRDSDAATTTIDRTNNWFIFNSVPAAMFTAGGLYNVRVAVMTTGAWSPFSDVCQITAPGGSASVMTSLNQNASVFNAVAHPSPFTADFGIEVTTSSAANIELKVYDMLGKLIESRELKLEDLMVEKIGARYPSGVYNVVLSQDGVVKTLRIIKR